MADWLLKTEPEEYSYDDLVREQVGTWDGVTNPVAQRNMRAMQVGDRCIIYHTGDVRAAVGLARVVRGPYPDPSDARGRLVLVDVAPVRALERPVSLAEIRTLAVFDESPLVRIGRLSVVPLTSEQMAALGVP